jgi:SAM-dependent methyltransferase
MTSWWQSLAACPACGESLTTPLDADARGNCRRCGLSWSQDRNVTVWHQASALGDERLLPAEWIAGRTLSGRRRALFLGKRLLWNLLKVAGFPLRHLVRRRLAAFQAQSLVDTNLAEQWRGHYLKDLDLPRDAVMFEYSYRKLEKLGFARLLGYRVVIEDIRRHPWWDDYPHAWFQVVPPSSSRVPLKTATVDVAFTDGVIFDMEASSLEPFFRECLRILKPCGYLVIWAGNSLSRTRARSEVRWHGRIHSLAHVKKASLAAGFREVDVSFEGFAPPFLPAVINMLRGALTPSQFKTYEHDSWLARWQRPEKRAYWLLRLVKTIGVG